MIPEKLPSGRCGQDAPRAVCPLRCKTNRFAGGDLTIDTWEIRCLDCGLRETVAYRSDDPDAAPIGGDPRVCPFCRVRQEGTGISPCGTSAT